MMNFVFCCFALLLLGFSERNVKAELNLQPFPEGFLFGTATASYQVEGAWNVSGKGENIWDRLTHEHPDRILNHTNGDDACKSYYKIAEDVALLKELGVDFYRFSLSWSRILPTGLSYNVNPDGIRYYKSLIKALLDNGIQPFVTLYHWDLPQPLQELGGWANPTIVDYYADYARIAFENFGDSVKYWLTFNEPLDSCAAGYMGTKPPGVSSDGIATYLCAHNVIKSHARVYHLYNNTYKPTQNGKVSITLNTAWLEPGSNSTEDINAAERGLQFTLGWFANPIYSKDGDYPPIMKMFIDERSTEEGFSSSRLPQFTAEEIVNIRGTYDFFGLNAYSTYIVNDRPPAAINIPGYLKDMRINSYQDPNWPPSASEWLKVVPWGFTKLLNWIKETYNNPDIYVTENGFSDHGEIDDQGRIEYYKLYLSALLDAIYEHEVNVKAYTAWSLLDNFEWLDGYTKRFGLYFVDFDSPDRIRTPKSSSLFYKEVIANRILPNSTTNYDYLISKEL